MFGVAIDSYCVKEECKFHELCYILSNFQPPFLALKKSNFKTIIIESYFVNLYEVLLYFLYFEYLALPTYIIIF